MITEIPKPMITEIPKPMIMEIPKPMINGNYQTNTDGSSDCDSECRKTLDNTMGMLNNLIKPTIP